MVIGSPLQAPVQLLVLQFNADLHGLRASEHPFFTASSEGDKGLGVCLTKPKFGGQFCSSAGTPSTAKS